MNAATHHPRRALALGVAIAIALLALLPGSWGDALAQTAGAPSPTPLTCSAGFTLTGNSCVRTVTNDPVTVTGVTGGQEVTIGEPGSEVTVTIPAGYPAGATFTAETKTTTTITSDGTTSTISEVVSLTCTGNCTQQPVTFTVSLSFILTVDLTGAETADLRAQLCSELGLTTANCQINFIRSSASSTMRLDPGVGQQLISFGVSDSSESGAAPQQTGPDTIEATLLAGGFLEADLPPGDWGIQAVAIENPPTVGAPGPAAPSPANTGMGGDNSGATNPLAIALGAAALAGIAGLGGRYAVRRRA